MLSVDAIVLCRELRRDGSNIQLHGLEYDRQYASFPADGVPFVVFLVMRASPGKHTVALWMVVSNGADMKLQELAFEATDETRPVMVFWPMPGGKIHRPGSMEFQVRDEQGTVLAKAFKHISPAKQVNPDNSMPPGFPAQG